MGRQSSSPVVKGFTYGKYFPK
jgi:hypothetical protein